VLPLINEAFGWAWLTLGMVAGAALGARFQDESWLGGYSSWRRRLLRLGHIAMIALGMLNILFALSAPRIALPAPWPSFAGWLMIAGAVLMPLCCALAAIDKRHCRWFPVPVLALLGAGAITATGLARALFLQGGAP